MEYFHEDKIPYIHGFSVFDMDIWAQRQFQHGLTLKLMKERTYNQVIVTYDKCFFRRLENLLWDPAWEMLALWKGQ